MGPAGGQEGLPWVGGWGWGWGWGGYSKDGLSPRKGGGGKGFSHAEWGGGGKVSGSLEAK